MNLKFIVPDMEKTFGEITFGGPGRETTQNANNRRVAISRRFNFFSSIQRADALEVILPGKAGAKNFPYETPIRLVEPRITVRANVIRDNSYPIYTLNAKDMIPVADDEISAGDPVQEK